MKKIVTLLIVLGVIFISTGCSRNLVPEKAGYSPSPTEEIKAEEVQGEWTGIVTERENTEYTVFLNLNEDGNFIFEELNTSSSGDTEVVLEGTWHIESDQLILNIQENNHDRKVIPEDDELKFSYEITSDSLTLEHDKQVFILIRKNTGTAQ